MTHNDMRLFFQGISNKQCPLVAPKMLKYMCRCHHSTYIQTSDIRPAKSQSSNVSCVVSRLSLPNPLKPSVKSRMKMLGQRRQAMLQLHLSDQQFYCLLRCGLY